MRLPVSLRIRVGRILIRWDQLRSRQVGRFVAPSIPTDRRWRRIHTYAYSNLALGRSKRGGLGRRNGGPETNRAELLSNASDLLWSWT